MVGNAAWWWVAAGILLVLAVAACCSHVIIRGTVTRRGADDNADIEVSALYGLVRYHMKVPVVLFENRELKLKARTAGPMVGVSETEAEIDKNAIERFFERMMEFLRFTRDLTGLAKHLVSRIKLTELRWTTDVGTGDAVSTAMATGLAWSVKTAITGVLSQLVRLRTNPHLAVAPHFNSTRFETAIACQARIRLWHLLLAGMRLFGRILKVKGGLKGWLELLTKPKPQPSNA